MKTLLAKRRERLDLTQCQMAALLKTVQSEVSKTEGGEVPENVAAWARAYRTTKRKFQAECQSARWDLPLWKYAVATPQDVEGIECFPRVSVNLGANPAVARILELDAQGRHREADQVAVLEAEMEAIA